MRFKVDLHPDVQRFLDQACTAEERTDFRRMYRLIGEQPIRFSKALHDPTLSRYMVRAFEFDGCLAIFDFSRDRSRIKV